jgi:hypothetical protein
MKLPVLETPSYAVTLPLSNQKITVRPYLIGEELSFLTHMEQENKEGIVNSYFDIVKNCIMTKDFDIEKMSILDFVYTLVFIRSKSKGETVDVDKKCRECEHEEAFSFDILKSLQVFNKEKTQDIFKPSDNVDIEIGVPTSSLFRTIASMEESDQVVLYTIAASIKHLSFGDKVYKDFSEEDLIENIIKRLTKKQIADLTKLISGLASLKSVVTATCSKCGNEQEYVTDDILDFLS